MRGALERANRMKRAHWIKRDVVRGACGAACGVTSQMVTECKGLASMRTMWSLMLRLSQAGDTRF